MFLIYVKDTSLIIAAFTKKGSNYSQTYEHAKRKWNEDRYSKKI